MCNTVIERISIYILSDRQMCTLFLLIEIRIFVDCFRNDEFVSKWSSNVSFLNTILCYILTFDPAQNAIQGDAPEGRDRFQWQLGVLYFDLRPGPKMLFLYTGRKWHIPTASNRKRSRGRIKAYDMGHGEGPIVPTLFNGISTFMGYLMPKSSL